MRPSKIPMKLTVAALVVSVQSASISEYLATENVGVLPAPPSTFSFTNTTTGSNTTRSTSLTGLAAASQCNVERLSYSNALAEWDATVTDTAFCSKTVYTYTWESIVTNVSIDWTTFCDSHPRTPSGFTYPTTTGSNTGMAYDCPSQSRLHSGTFPTPSPSCTIAPSDCGSLYEESVYRVGYSDAKTTPLCTSGPGFSVGCGDCTIFANGMQLFYWPESRTTGICAGNGSMSTTMFSAEAPTPSAVVRGNQTYSYPYAYMSFYDIFATAANSALCGTPLSNYVITMQTKDLSTLSFSSTVGPNGSTDWYQWSTQSMDLANLNYPVPWTAWVGMEACALDPSFCNTMSADYAPQVVMPSWLTSVQDQWTTCAFHTGVIDPPVALTQVAQADAPTVPTMSGTLATSSPSPGAYVSVAPATSTAPSTTLPVPLSADPMYEHRPADDGDC